MQIQKKTFIEFIDLPKDQPYWNYLSVVIKQYCGPLSVHGACSCDCTACKSTLQDVFSNLEQARVPIALVTWRLRNAYAIAQETKSEREKTPYIRKQDIYGIQAPELHTMGEIMKEMMKKISK